MPLDKFPKCRLNYRLLSKPVLLGDEPVDVANYSAATRKVGGKFPHDTTADQFFDESQFESYRMLGRVSIDALEQAAHGPLARIRLPRDAELRKRPVAERPDATTESETKEPRKQPLIQVDGGMADNLLRPAAALAGATALTTAIATTVALTISGSVKLEPPTHPIPVSGSVQLEPPGELRLNDADRQTLTNLTLTQRGLRLNSEDLDKLKIGISFDGTGGKKQNPESIPITLSVDKPAWKLDVEDKKIEVKPGNLTLVDEGKLSELNRSLGKVADALEKNSIGTALGTISGTLSDITQ